MKSVKRFVSLLLCVVLAAASLGSITVSANVPNVHGSVFNIRIVGSPVVGEKLRIEYDLYDPAGKETNIKNTTYWYRQNAEDGPRNATFSSVNIGANNGKQEYTVAAADIGQYISVGVLTTALTKVAYRTIGIGPVTASAPATPTVSGVTTGHLPGTAAIAGSVPGQALYGLYNYTSSEAEGESRYQWYISDTENGTYAAIEGATARSYTPPVEQYKKYIKFAVTPVTESGAAGTEKKSFDVALVGNAAHRAFVASTTNYYQGGATSGLVNGITDFNLGGMLSYAGADSITVDLGRIRTLEGGGFYALTYGTVKFSYSETGEAGSYIPMHTKNYAGDENQAEDIAFANANAIEFKPGGYRARYVKLDINHASNTGLGEIYMFVKVDYPPSITLSGEVAHYMFKGESFIEPGFSAIDAEDGNLTDAVVVDDGGLDVNTAGSYTMTYTVTDSDGKTVSVERTVIVAENFKTKGDLAFEKLVETSSGSGGENLVDGNPYSVWALDGTTGSAVVDLGDVQYISSVSVLENEKDSGKPNRVTSYEISASENGSAWTSIHSEQTLGSLVHEFPPVKVRYIKLDIKGASAPPEISDMVLLFTDKGKLELASSALSIGALADVTEDFALPRKGLYDSEIIWKSSNTSVLSDEGSVFRQPEKATVTLTATLKLGDETLMREFSPITIKGTGTGSPSGGGSGGGGKTSGSFVIPMPPIAGEIPQPPPADGRFKDIPNTHWAKEYVEELHELGIVNGKTETAFEPEAGVTRAEYLKLLVTALNLTADDAKPAFEDVDEADWFYPYVATGVGLEITRGDGQGRFNPNALVTRQDVAILTDNALRAAGITLQVSQQTEEFSDADEIASYAASSVSYLQSGGILNGSNGAFLPVNNMTRAESAKVILMIFRISQTVGDE